MISCISVQSSPFQSIVTLMLDKMSLPTAVMMTTEPQTIERQDPTLKLHTNSDLDSASFDIQMILTVTILQ